MTEKLFEWFSEYELEDIIRVIVLEQNKYEIQNEIFKVKDLIREITNKNFKFCGGNDREFYVEIYDFDSGKLVNDYTFIINLFETETELSF